MDETNFDALCEGASPEEAKRLRKILSEWCQGEEDSFPVQLALLTCAQWRAAGRMPQQLALARQQLEQTLAEHRLQASAAFEEFTHEMDTRTCTLEQIIAGHTETTRKIMAEMRLELAHTETTAKRIQGRFELGVAEWEKARNDFIAQRERLREILIEVRNGYTEHEWFYFIMLLAVFLIFGIMIGVRIAR
ncbi:MAG TPA: hypothetical protein VL171_14055 [Verrucomicrobiae bacterium]|nr:hypothetical protein [Verrucomicrobiae bacterium]